MEQLNALAGGLVRCFEVKSALRGDSPFLSAAGGGKVVEPE